MEAGSLARPQSSLVWVLLSIYLELASSTLRISVTLLQPQEQTFRAPNTRQTEIGTTTLLQQQITENF